MTNVLVASNISYSSFVEAVLSRQYICRQDDGILPRDMERVLYLINCHACPCYHQYSDKKYDGLVIVIIYIIGLFPLPIEAHCTRMMTVLRIAYDVRYVAKYTIFEELLSSLYQNSNAFSYQTKKCVKYSSDHCSRRFYWDIRGLYVLDNIENTGFMRLIIIRDLVQYKDTVLLVQQF